VDPGGQSISSLAIFAPLHSENSNGEVAMQYKLKALTTCVTFVYVFKMPKTFRDRGCPRTSEPIWDFWFTGSPPGGRLRSTWEHLRTPVVSPGQRSYTTSTQQPFEWLICQLNRRTTCARSNASSTARKSPYQVPEAKMKVTWSAEGRSEI